MIVSFTSSCSKKNGSRENINKAKQVNQANEHLTEKDSINGNEYIYYFKKEKDDSSQTEYKKLDSLVIL